MNNGGIEGEPIAERIDRSVQALRERDAIPKDQLNYEWEIEANCLGEDPDIFFPEQYQSNRSARAICRACDVWVDCLANAIQKRETQGILGGLTNGEREKVANILNRSRVVQDAQ